jgi:transketolase
MDEFPDRFFNSGVAEQNMMGLSAGLASEGMKPFVYSIANFPTFRCAEQIRNDVAYHNLPVTIVSVGSGLSYGALGYSHHAVQDLALMRSFPNMTLCTPCDPNEVSASLDYILSVNNPCYLRLGKAGEANITNENYDCLLSSLRLIKSFKINDSVTPLNIIVPGSLITKINQYIEFLSPNQTINLFSCPVWSSDDAENLISSLASLEKILVIEEHLLGGGFGSWILESMHMLPNFNNHVIRIMALNNSICGEVASQEELINFGGINLNSFKDIINSF